MSNIILKKYSGVDIPFGKGEQVWLNATEAAKVFGKEAREFFSSKQTHEYMKALAKRHGYSEREISRSETTKEIAEKYPQFVYVVHGNGNAQKQGTWMSRKLAIRFAQWLDANFAVWCDEQIEELLENAENPLAGFAIPQTKAEALRLAADLAEEIEVLKPKAEFYDVVTQSDDELDMNDVAKILPLGFGRNTLFEQLRKIGILMSDNKPYQCFVDSGYFRCVEQMFKDAKGKTRVNVKTVVTQRGLHYIANKFNVKQLAS